MKQASSRLRLIGAVVLFGTIGVFRRYIPLPSGLLSMARGLIGAAFLLLLMCARRQRPDGSAIRANLLPLLLSGTFIGFNWILLFEAYRYTTVATATMCYYMEPIFVLLAAPLLLHERLTVRRLCCVAAALAGMVLVSGVLSAGFTGLAELKGVLLGLGAAVLYAGDIILNKTVHDITTYDRTVVQLATAGAVLIPYTLLAEHTDGPVTLPAIALVLVLGIVHTGIAYALYFGGLADLPAQTVALLSYLDPIVAVLLSVFLLREESDPLKLVGAVLVLCAAAVSELPEKPRRIRKRIR